jgi:signal transduction histidine kinase/ligand-binding sensor domain-containing protein/DNA-binding response OmpR family regulator
MYKTGCKWFILHMTIALFFHAPLSAKEKDAEWKYRIRHLTTENGLSQNTIDCIFKDSRGFIWFGTWNGLNRYDGYNFLTYKKESDKNSLSSNFIHSIAEDKNGVLWIATRNGLNRFDFRKDRFTRFFHDSLTGNSPSGNWINIVYCDMKGTIWAGTNNAGLNRIESVVNENDFVFTHFMNNPFDKSSISSNDIRAIFEDSKGRFWIGTSRGLNLMDLHSGKFSRFKPADKNDSILTNEEIRCIYEDKKGIIWIGTTQGLVRWDETEGSIKRFLHDPDNLKSLSHSVINEITEDPQQNLYIGTLGGVDILNNESGTFDHIPIKTKPNLSLNNEFINSIFCDNSGIIWIGTDKGGINNFNVCQKDFHYLAYNPDISNSLSNNIINSVMDETEFLWVGTAGGGLNRVNKKTGSITYFKNIPHSSECIGSDFITSIIRDKDGELWVGTWGMGFDKMVSNQSSYRFIHNRNIPGVEGSLVNDFISTLYEDKEGNFWVGTEGGLDLYLKTTGNFRHLCRNSEVSPVISEVGCLLRDSSGNLWIGTRNGLYYIASSFIPELITTGNTSGIICIRNNPDNQTSLSENYVISLFENSNGSIWIGTFGNGLNKLDEDKNAIGKDPKFSRYTQADGLCNNVVYGIIEDENKTLWLSTDFGLSHFIPQSKTFHNYYVTDGLLSNQLYWSACTKGTDGTLYFGGMNGLNYFHSGEIIDNKQLPGTRITDFKIYNQSVKVDVRKGKKRNILEQVISETEIIHLSYRQNTFSFEFSALSYDLPEKNTYAYKMEGVDADWIEVSSDRRYANYTKLKGGEYIFKVKAANNDGIWNDTPTSLKIIISPPFWLSWWFKMILILTILTSIYIYLKLHTRSLRIQKTRLEEQVIERTARIEQQKQELLRQAETLQEKNDQLARRQELIESQKVQLENQNDEIIGQRDKLIELNKKVKAVNQLKLKFFTNISHEFKTPLTLILGPLEKLIKGWNKKDDTWQMLGLINRNAERLLHLINQLMDFRKVERGKMNLHITSGKASIFIENIISSFRELATERNINLIYSGDVDDSEVWFDHEKIENILYNLLSNAFKYTPANGKIWISLKYFNNDQTLASDASFSNEPSWMQIEVGDTGIGIPPDKLLHIFKRFYRVENSNAAIQGSGIGLALTRELVKTHQGNISVNSDPSKGTVFCFNLPCSADFYVGNGISDDLYQSNYLKSQVNLLKYELLSGEHKVRGLPATQMAQNKDCPLILLAEDNNDLREFIVSCLDKTYNIIDTDNGKSAYELAVQFNPDIVISDIMMPLMDGIQLCNMIKENIDTSHIPVILLTSKGSVESQIEGFQAGADEYIAKPFSLELLEIRLANLIESRRKLQEIFNLSQKPDPVTITSNATDQKFLNKAMEIVGKNLDNPDFSATEFARVMSVSRTLLHKKLTALTNQSASDFINTIRLKRSCEMIVSGEFNISEVAYAVGYNDPKYYSRIFRKYFGVAPSEYVKNNKAKAS